MSRHTEKKKKNCFSKSHHSKSQFRCREHWAKRNKRSDKRQNSRYMNQQTGTLYIFNICILAIYSFQRSNAVELWWCDIHRKTLKCIFSIIIVTSFERYNVVKYTTVKDSTHPIPLNDTRKKENREAAEEEEEKNCLADWAQNVVQIIDTSIVSSPGRSEVCFPFM